MIKKIGFIGTGLMGLPMAKNILKSGYNLKAFNRTQNKAEPLKEFGGEIAETIKDVVKDNEVIITMLTDDNAINEVMSSSDFLDNLNPGTTVIDMSSIKPATAIMYGNKLKSYTYWRPIQKKHPYNLRYFYLLVQNLILKILRFKEVSFSNSQNPNKTEHILDLLIKASANHFKIEEYKVRLELKKTCLQNRKF